jgi:hypothetical protein
VGLVVDKVKLGQVFFRVLRFPLPIFIPPSSPSSQSAGARSGRRAEWTQLGLHPPLCEFNYFKSNKNLKCTMYKNIQKKYRERRKFSK